MRGVPSSVAGARPARGGGPMFFRSMTVCSRFIQILLVFAGLSPVFFACAKTESTASADASDPNAQRPIFVEAMAIRPQTFEIEVALTGQLEAELEVVVRSELDGVIRSIEFEEGQSVSQGDLLFTMRDEEQRARLSQAQAEERLARDIYDRTQTLTNRDISSLARRAEASASLDEARAKVDLAQLNLDRTRILAPFDGVVGHRLVGPGEWVEPQTELVPVSAIDRLQLHYLLPEPSIRLAVVGGTVHARVVAFEGERFEGETFFVSPSVDRATRRLLAKAWIPNPDHRLKPGMFANVDVVVLEKEDVLLVPDSALVYDRHGTYLWRLDEEGRAEKIPVEIGIRRFGQVEVLAGIAPGDRVVTAGVNKVTAGAPLEIISAAESYGSPGIEGQAGGQQG